MASEVTKVEESAPEVTSLVVSTQPSLNFSKSTLKAFTENLSEEIMTSNYIDVQTFKFIYKTTDYKNKEVQASGVLLIPENAHEVALASIQHGTLKSDAEAPTNSYLGLNELTVGVLLAANGVVVLIPDYIGYGVTNDQKHPYEHRVNLAKVSYDFILAAHEYLDSEEITTNGKLFLTGYSEGGYATMALHQFIEKENKIAVTHSISGAGAYIKTAFAKEILKKDEDLEFLPSYLWVLDVYNTMFDNLKRPWTYYLNEPYASNLNSLDFINAPIDPNLISSNPKILFKETFIENILNNTDTEFLNVLNENDVYDWKPIAPITLFQSIDDKYVYPLNALTAFESIKKNGGEINYITVEGFDHQQATIPFYLKVLELIDTMK